MIFKKYISEDVSGLKFKKLILQESFEDIERRCEFCDTLLNDMGTCPKCDDGEEDYGDRDNDVNESTTSQSLSENVTEELSARDKLIRAYPGVFSFDSSYDSSANKIEENVQTEEVLSNKEKLERAFPDISFNWRSSSNNDSSMIEDLSEDSYDDSYEDSYDDEFDMDDIEQDRRHAALYGGDRMYCDCGQKLSMSEWGSYCPVCDSEELEKARESQLSMFDDDMEDI